MGASVATGGGGEFSGGSNREVCEDSCKEEEDGRVGGEERKGRGLHDDDMIYGEFNRDTTVINMQLLVSERMCWFEASLFCEKNLDTCLTFTHNNMYYIMVLSRTVLPTQKSMSPTFYIAYQIIT